MKTLAIITALLMSVNCFADNSAPPDYLKDGVITVKLKNGKEYTFSANEYMVVKRGQKISATESKAAESKSAPVNQKPSESLHKNIVSVEGVYGTNGIDVKRDGSTYEMTEKKGLGLGLQYQRKLNDDGIYGNIRVDTNGNTGLGVGKGF